MELVSVGTHFLWDFFSLFWFALQIWITLDIVTGILGDFGFCYSPLKHIGWFVLVTSIFIKLNLKLNYRLWQFRVSILSLIPHINLFFSPLWSNLWQNKGVGIFWFTVWRRCQSFTVEKVGWRWGKGQVQLSLCPGVNETTGYIVLGRKQHAGWETTRNNVWIKICHQWPSFSCWGPHPKGYRAWESYTSWGMLQPAGVGIDLTGVTGCRTDSKPGISWDVCPDGFSPTTQELSVYHVQQQGESG